MRYGVKPRAVWDEALGCEIELPNLWVHVEEDGVPTGLLDKDGNELYRYEKVKMGFVK